MRLFSLALLGFCMTTFSMHAEQVNEKAKSGEKEQIAKECCYCKPCDNKSCKACCGQCDCDSVAQSESSE